MIYPKYKTKARRATAERKKVAANAQCLCRSCHALAHGIRDCTEYLRRGEREAAV